RELLTHRILSYSTPHPQRPPLFPYTTLFRSRSSHDRTRREEARYRASRSLPACPNGAASQTGNTASLLRLADKPWPDVPADAVSDRKSTRLNSSHVSISYAVFCLKKKTFLQQ